MRDILIIDDDRSIARSLELNLTQKGYDVGSAHSAGQGMETFRRQPAKLVFLDVRLPDGSGLDLLARILELAPETKIVIITAFQDMRAAIQAVRTGAFDFIRKPLDLDEVLSVVGKALSSRGLSCESGLHPADGTPMLKPEIVGKHRAINDVIKQIGLLSKSRVSVLIQGESGTGKELVARAIHEAGTPDKPFVAINCSSIVPNLLESELFGHERGSFTGADARKTGKFELAGQGSIFFDEIGDMSPQLQAKILRALEEREYERVGGVTPVQLQARVLAATNRDLDAMVNKALFREDLFFRLSVARIALPALKDRKEDIPLLVSHLLSRINRELDRDIKGVPDEVMARLMQHTWPGNVRELYNVLMRSVTLTRGDRLDPATIEFSTVQSAAERTPLKASTIATLREVEREHIARALHETGWNITRTASLLGTTPPTLRKKIKDHKLTKPGA